MPRPDPGRQSRQLALDLRAGPTRPDRGVGPPAVWRHPEANHALNLGAARVHYRLRRSDRRTIGFTVSADGLAVQAPRRTSLRVIESALRERQNWILRKLDETHTRALQQQAQQIRWRDGVELPFLGGPLVLRLSGSRSRIAVAVPVPSTAAPEIAWLPLPPDASPEQIRSACEAWFRERAREWFTQRLAHFAPQLGVQPTRLTLSSARTRWGSASSSGAIRLNWRLLHFDRDIVDYVVVHELAHLLEMNHSPRFWAHVASVLPDYMQRRRALRETMGPVW